MHSNVFRQNLLLVCIPVIITGAITLFIYFMGQKNVTKHTNSKNEYKLSGTIVDEADNKSIINAEISVVGRNEIYYSESNGNFIIPFKDSISHIRIRVAKKNYSTFDKSFDIPINDVTIPLTKQMAK